MAIIIILMKKYFLPFEEKLGNISLAIDAIHQLLHACVEYRNVALEFGATKEDLCGIVGYFDEEDFDSKVEFALKGLDYLFLNTLSEASYQPKETATKAEIPKVEVHHGYVIKHPATFFLDPAHKVATKEVKKEFIHRYIENGEEFPVEYAKDCISDMDYADFLKTPYWKSIALYVKERDGRKCSICGATKALEVHHLTYDNHGDELHHLDDLTCICRRCHENLHNGK